jgi:hypothetical protein
VNRVALSSDHYLESGRVQSVSVVELATPWTTWYSEGATGSLTVSAIAVSSGSPAPNGGLGAF